MIRKYEQEEISHLVEIWEQAAILAHPFLSNEFHQYVKKAMREIYLPNSDTWVYELSGEVQGFISMLENEIAGLFVSPKHHSKGIGTALMNYVGQHHKALEVEVFQKNAIGKPFYEKHGFTIIKEYLQEETGETVLRMKK